VLRRSGLIAFAAVVGPGVLAGLSDDDPAGITTYSILGADYGYELLWVLLLSTVALMVFHELGLRMGVATGQGLTGLVRQRFGLKAALGALATLVVANLGTTCAEFAGVAASLELAGVSRYVSVPLAAVGVSLLVARGGFRRVEHVLLALASVFATYVVAGLLADPDWGETARGLVAPSMPGDTAALVAATATVGTTLAPWGLAFIQSYAVDKRLTPERLGYERVDVFVGAAMTGIIGVFVVIACAATLFPEGRSIDSAADAAAALEPLAGGAASALFGAGLLAAALLAASILPLSTAYSISETLGYESALDDPVREAPLFYGSYALIVAIGAGIVLIPGAPLIDLLYLTQALNAILLLPLMVFLCLIARDRRTMGSLTNGRLANATQLAVVVLVALCVGTLAALAAGG
jgi:NRAMP (natural resistance-associated macrophage protein)-like metal ion transporter